MMTHTHAPATAAQGQKQLLATTNFNFNDFAAAHEAALWGDDHTQFEDSLGFSLPALGKIAGTLVAKAMFWRKPLTFGQAFKRLIEAMVVTWGTIPPPLRRGIGASVTGLSIYSAVRGMQSERDRQAFEGERLFVRDSKSKADFVGTCISWGRTPDTRGRDCAVLRLDDGELMQLPLDCITADIRLGDSDTFGMSTKVDAKWKNERVRAKFPVLGKERSMRDDASKARTDATKDLPNVICLTGFKAEKAEDAKAEEPTEAPAETADETPAEAAPAAPAVADVIANFAQVLQLADMNDEKHAKLLEVFSEMAEKFEAIAAEPDAETDADPEPEELSAADTAPKDRTVDQWVEVLLDAQFDFANADEDALRAEGMENFAGVKVMRTNVLSAGRALLEAAEKLEAAAS